MKELCNRILERIKQAPESVSGEFLPVINRKISKIERDSNGFWGMTKSDKLFLTKLIALKNFINKGDSYGNILKMAKELDDITCDKVKIVFLTQETTCWPSFESVYKACCNDKRFITQVVYVPFEHINSNKSTDYYEIYKVGMQLPIIKHDEYLLAEESPDIAFFIKPYDGIPNQYYIDEICKVVERSAYIRYGFEIAEWNVDYHFRMLLQYKAWKFIVFGDMVKNLTQVYGYNNAKNVVAWGHPRADHYTNFKERRKNIPESWKKKCNGRKTVLWNTQHTILPNQGAGTFLKWKDEVFEYFEKNHDMVLLWRPHPLMFGAIVNNGYMSEEELTLFVESLAAKDNILIDASSDYRNAFYASDAIITDGTAFLIEYLYTHNPLVYTIKDTEQTVYFKQEIKEALYIAEDSNDLVKCLNMIKNELDPMKSKRADLAKRLLTIHEGGNGEFIKDHLYDDLYREVAHEI